MAKVTRGALFIEGGSVSPTSGSPIAVVVIPTTGDVTATGLDGGVSSDEDRARKVALELRAGQVECNGGRFSPPSPSVATSGPGRPARTATRQSASTWR